MPKSSQENLLDFLYYDAEKVAPFLAQLGEHGNLQQIKQTDLAGEVHSNKVAFSGDKQIPLFAKVQMGYDRTWGDEKKEGAERVYDPLWANARTLISLLRDKKMIVRDIASASIGQFVMIGGALTIIDMPILKNLMEMDRFKENMKKTAFATHNVVDLKDPRHKIICDEVDIAIQIIKFLPHPVQARLVDEHNNMVWSTLSEKSLVSSTSNLMLKSGFALSGQWNVLGILDAMPGPITMDRGQLSDSPFSQELLIIYPFLQQLGRPVRAYGLTPLLIYREVSGCP